MDSILNDVPNRTPLPTAIEYEDSGLIRNNLQRRDSRQSLSMLQRSMSINASILIFNRPLIGPGSSPSTVKMGMASIFLKTKSWI